VRLVLYLADCWQLAAPFRQNVYAWHPLFTPEIDLSPEFTELGMRNLEISNDDDQDSRRCCAVDIASLLYRYRYRYGRSIYEVGSKIEAMAECMIITI
jgi:hypothetical protein